MLSRLARLPLRRCVHTASTASRQWSRTTRVVFGASAATAAYLTWQLMNERNHLALDSTNPTKMTQGSTHVPSPSHPPDSPSDFSETKSRTRAHIDDAFIPDQEGSPDTENDASEESSSGTSEPSGSGVGGGGGGAFNPQTGEINWDCPCLGGMAHGPCGPEFKEAFSCFVFSEAEPKGIDCVAKFQAMQTCFRAHPEVYADEIMDDDDDEPINSENPEGLPPVTDSTETIANDASVPEPTSKKPQLH